MGGVDGFCVLECDWSKTSVDNNGLVSELDCALKGAGGCGLAGYDGRVLQVEGKRECEFFGMHGCPVVAVVTGYCDGFTLAFGGGGDDLSKYVGVGSLGDSIGCLSACVVWVVGPWAFFLEGERCAFEE